MKAYVTSIGEPTTELCIWALERNGFEVQLIKDQRSLWSKLKDIYYDADDSFLRVDADIIVNRSMTPKLLSGLDDGVTWWWQFITFDWYKLDINHSMAFIAIAALPALKANIGRFKLSPRPETDASRLSEFHNPRRMKTYEKEIMGLHGFGIKDIEPIKRMKAIRGQLSAYDFEMTERLNQL